MVEFTMEVEPIVTQQLTGRLGAALFTYRGKAWRVTLYNRTGDQVECRREGALIAWQDAPIGVRKVAQQFANLLATACGLSARS